MLERLIEFKSICDENLANNLPEYIWDLLQNYVNSLQPAKKLSTFLQAEQITIGDFYINWLMCKIELKNIYMPTRWNSTLHMISRFVELLAAVKSTAGEVLLAYFVAEHNLSMNNLRVGSRTKTTAIIKSVTGDTEKENLIADLKIRKFLLLVDKSTGRGCVKLLRIVFRYYRNKKIKDAFFALIPVQDATGEKLYEHLHNSVASRLLEDILHLYVVKCICHSFALCASYACTKLPREPEGLVRDVYNYISTSPKRTGLLKEFQQFLALKPHKILHPCQTRWKHSSCFLLML
ncbi:hypothetical protein ABMA27_009102 [Loxostege sticticalis]|uniref:Uncharacterized protein n=1 Tax=Loxostege sticticalis TaxID=481309 RepID=A0ABR3H9Y0_LOXSC